MTNENLVFNSPPGWPTPPVGWKAPAGWAPDPSWPEAPEDWPLWVPRECAGTPEAENYSQNSSVANPNRSAADIEQRLFRLEAENASLRSRLEAQVTHGATEDIVDLDDERVLQSVGIYRYHHPLENAPAYKERLSQLSTQIADLVKAGSAIEKSSMFTFDNSLAKGRAMTANLSKLMLRAYNAEADSSLRTLRSGNVAVAKKRLEASRKAIAKLGLMMEMRISEAFHSLRIQEVELTADWWMKKQEERELAKEERALLREQKRVEAELAEERENLEKERAHIQNTLLALKETGGADDELEARLKEIDAAIEQNDYRAANVRAGYVYVISNPGAFGPNVVKIGLTRRLEPLQRISELSGASVPFRFDVHALFFSEDAVLLERELHAYFADRAVNQANRRKEFFFASPLEVRDVLIEKVGNLLEFKESAEAPEYLQSIHNWPKWIKSAGVSV